MSTLTPSRAVSLVSIAAVLLTLFGLCGGFRFAPHVTPVGVVRVHISTLPQFERSVLSGHEILRFDFRSSPEFVSDDRYANFHFRFCDSNTNLESSVITVNGKYRRSARDVSDPKNVVYSAYVPVSHRPNPLSSYRAPRFDLSHRPRSICAWITLGADYQLAAQSNTMVFPAAMKTNGPACVLTFESPALTVDPETFSRPPFFRPPGRPEVVGRILDGRVDWDDVGKVIAASCCMLAPKKLAEQFRRSES